MAHETQRNIAAAMVMLSMLCTPHISVADQDQNASRFTLGLSAGFNWATISGAEVESNTAVSTSSETSFRPRYRMYYALTETVAIETGLGYARRSGTIESTATDSPSGGFTTTHTATLALSYVELPLRLRLKALEPGAFTVTVFAGPIVGFNTKAQYDFLDIEVNTQTGVVATSRGDLDVGSRVGSIDVVGSVGFEVGTMLDDVMVSLVADFAVGFGDAIASGSDLPEVQLSKGTSQEFGLAISVSTRL